MTPSCPGVTPRTNGLLRLAVALVAVWAVAWSQPACAAGPAELANPGFDLAATNGVPEGWTLDPAVRSKGKVQVLAGYPGGQGQVLVLQPNRSNEGERLLGVGQRLDASAWRGRQLSVTARLAASAGASAVLGVHALGKAGDLGSIQLRQGESSGEWIAQTRTLAVPASAEFLIVYAVAGGTSGRAAFDAIRLASDTAPQAGAAAPGTARTEISVEPSQTLRQIPAGLFGTNVEWIFDGQGLWSARDNALDRQATGLAREVAPTVLRFPGGAFSDTYHWRDGVGDAARRPVTAHYSGGPSSRHSMGSQEVATLARELGADLMFTVNAGTGSAQEAAAWVAYAAREIQPKVRLWEVGNELYMKSDLSGVRLTADQYADRYLAYASAMRAADPAIRVGAIGGLNQGSYHFISDDRWTETLLRRAAAQIDFLAVHNAYAPVVMGAAEEKDVAKVYRAMLAAPRQVEANLKAVSALLERHETPGRRISIGVTEWGPLFHVLPKSPWVDHVKTMGSALFVASTLNVFMRSPRVELANFFKLADQTFMGWLGRRDAAWAQTAPAMVFSLYRRALGRTLVRTSVRSPTFDSPGLGAVNAQKEVPWVDAVATYDAGVLVVMLVNKSDSLTLDGEITLGGVRSFSDVSATTISAPSWDAHTGTQLPKIPGIEWARQQELSRFSKGSPAEVSVTRGQLAASAKGPSAAARSASLRYTLRPASVTALRFGRLDMNP